MSSQNTGGAHEAVVLAQACLTSAKSFTIMQLPKKEAIAECSNNLCISEQMRTAYENKSEHFGI